MSYTPKQIEATITFISKLILPPECEPKTQKWLENQMANLIDLYVKKNYPSIKFTWDHDCLKPLLPGLKDRGLSFPKDKAVLLKITGESFVLSADQDLRTIYSNTDRKSFDKRLGLGF